MQCLAKLRVSFADIRDHTLRQGCRDRRRAEECSRSASDGIVYITSTRLATPLDDCEQTSGRALSTISRGIRHREVSAADKAGFRKQTPQADSNHSRPQLDAFEFCERNDCASRVRDSQKAGLWVKSKPTPISVIELAFVILTRRELYGITHEHKVAWSIRIRSL